MSRRYLSLQEAKAALRRGKAVEIFLGGFQVNTEQCIRWASFIATSEGVTGHVWEAFDQGSKDYVDVYTFDSPSGEYDEPVKSVVAPSLEKAANELGITEPKYVNQGIIQDEYLSYLQQRT